MLNYVINLIIMMLTSILISFPSITVKNLKKKEKIYYLIFHTILIYLPFLMFLY